uniref:Ovule protein n=1 Tax=Mesocestoides corti TaxID=53468 RepID=A0A5K3EFY9_MESCO
GRLKSIHLPLRKQRSQPTFLSASDPLSSHRSKYYSKSRTNNKTLLSLLPVYTKL